MFKFFFALVALTTIVSMGMIGKIGKVGSITSNDTVVQPAPMIVDVNGAISFPDRIPAPETVYQIRRALRMEDVEKLNAILVQNKLFMAPSSY